MNVSGPELLVIAFFLAVFVYPTYGAYKAFKSGNTGWGVAIIGAWLIGLGWLVGIVYLLVRRSASRSAS